MHKIIIKTPPDFWRTYNVVWSRGIPRTTRFLKYLRVLSPIVFLVVPGRFQTCRADRGIYPFSDLPSQLTEPDCVNHKQLCPAAGTDSVVVLRRFLRAALLSCRPPCRRRLPCAGRLQYHNFYITQLSSRARLVHGSSQLETADVR